MTVYTPQDAALIRHADSVAVLTGAGLPDDSAVSFHPDERITVWQRNPGYAVIGTWGDSGIDVIVDITDGSVWTAPSWSAEIDPLNATVRQLAESLAALNAARPLSDQRYESDDAAADHARGLLTAIDPETLADPDSFWRALIWDISNGDYTEH
ncbi:SUKH-4 family immunity protein [Actinoplanes sp. NPDC051851]|uniref:SUKH-4 family immunity protein n=1 Tax=Actinoplanes sp. NPDC051851 TaxID=3154753 RepID=UPI0034298439